MERRKRMVSRAGSCVAVLLAAFGAIGITAAPAAALTPEECEALVAEGIEAREDLAALIEARNESGSTATTSEAVGAYVNDLLAKAAINLFGFVSADAGAPLELCLPQGTTTLTMFSEPVVLFQGLVTKKFEPVTVQIPAGTSCGQHTLRATGQGVDQSVTFDVKGACGGTSPDILGVPLPRTGAELARLAAIGVGLTIVGAVVLRGRRAWQATP